MLNKALSLIIKIHYKKIIKKKNKIRMFIEKKNKRSNQFTKIT